MGDDADGRRCERYRTDGQLQNDAQIGVKVAPHREIRAGQQQRWQKQHQHQVRIELDIGRSRDERERNAAENECRGRRHAQPARQ